MFRHILEDKIRNTATLNNSGAKAHIIILSNKISPFTAKEILTFEIRKEKRYFYFFTIFLDYLLQYLQNALIIFSWLSIFTFFLHMHAHPSVFFIFPTIS
jgi:predicted CDP-diglyceride synthetase/phosphatidate cytidylyltransferase